MQVYYITRASLKTANKQYNNTGNDYEMTFNADTQMTLCEEQSGLPSIKFNFVSINQLAEKQPNTTVGRFIKTYVL